MSPGTHHCNALSIGETGILIYGPSGAGKSSLTMGLLERSALVDCEAGLVSDDRSILFTVEEKLFAKPPEILKGRIELRGYGIINHPSIDHAEIGLSVKMVDDHNVVRMPDACFATIEGVKLPEISVPVRHEQAAIRIIFAWLNENRLRKYVGQNKDYVEKESWQVS